MNELIKIENRSGKETVNARELHDFLEIQTLFKDWIVRKIEKYDFKENIDFLKVAQKRATSGGDQMVNDYFLTLEMAKELSMVENNEKGKEARQYFIECEKKLKSPMTLEEMTLQVITGMTARVKELENKIIEDKPKVDFYEDVTSSKQAIPMNDVAKILDKGLGRNKLFDFLRDKKIIMPGSTQPYQAFIDLGYFRVVMREYKKPSGEVGINKTTLVLPKGIEFINKVLKKNGIIK